MGAAAIARADAPAAKPPETEALKKLQAEAFAGLKAIFVCQKSFFAERDKYTANFDEMGFAPDPWCEDGARLKIKETDTPHKKIGCHFIYEIETLSKGGFRAYARGAVEPTLGVVYLVESEGRYAGIPRLNPK